MAIYGHIICLGDSLTHGARDLYGRCYPMELSDILWDRYGQRWVCIDEGVNGDTSTDVLRRSISVMRKYPDAQEVVLLCGTNDSKDAINMPVEIYRKNLEGILRNIAVYEKETLLCTIPCLKGFGAPDYSQESQGRINSYNKVIKELAVSDPTVKELVELRGIPEQFYADGVHLKNAGYFYIADRVADSLERKRSFTTKRRLFDERLGGK